VREEKREREGGEGEGERGHLNAGNREKVR